MLLEQFDPVADRDRRGLRKKSLTTHVGRHDDVRRLFLQSFQLFFAECFGPRWL